MILDPARPDSKLVFSESFRNRQAIQSRGGIITACSVQAGLSLRTPLVNNGDFEGSAGPPPAGWAVWQTTATRESGTRPGGTGLYVGRTAYDGSHATGGFYKTPATLLTVGKLYKTSGWVYVPAGVTPHLSDGAVSPWDGVAGPGWQNWDLTFIAQGTYFEPYCTGLGPGLYADWDDLICVPASGGDGISPTGASGRVTFPGTEATLINASQMTIALRFRMGANNNATSKPLLYKTPAAFNDNQFFVQFDSNRLLDCYVANAAGDFSNSFRITSALTLNMEYVVYAVYNGGLAVGSRGIWYAGGIAASTSITGTLPAAMRAGAAPVSIFNAAGGSGGAPDSDFVLYDARIYSEAWGAQQVQDDYLKQTTTKVFGGGF